MNITRFVRALFTASLFCPLFGQSNLEITSVEVIERQTKQQYQDESVVIIGTSDGMVRAIDADNNEQWRVDTGGPTVSAFTAENSHYSIMPAADGTLHINSREGMAKTSVKARMIVDRTPFVSSSDNLVFTGYKSSRLIGVNSGSGQIEYDSKKINHQRDINLQSQPHTQSVVSRAGIGSGSTTYSGGATGELSKSATNRLGRRSPVWISRTDYSFRAFDLSTGKERFNASYAELQPLHALHRLGQEDMKGDMDEGLWDSAIDAHIMSYTKALQRPTLKPQPFNIAKNDVPDSLPTVLRYDDGREKNLLIDDDSVPYRLGLSMFKGIPIVSAFSLQRMRSADMPERVGDDSDCDEPQSGETKLSTLALPLRIGQSIAPVFALATSGLLHSDTGTGMATQTAILQRGQNQGISLPGAREPREPASNSSLLDSDNNLEFEFANEKRMIGVDDATPPHPTGYFDRNHSIFSDKSKVEDPNTGRIGAVSRNSHSRAVLMTPHTHIDIHLHRDRQSQSQSRSIPLKLRDDSTPAALLSISEESNLGQAKDDIATNEVEDEKKWPVVRAHGDARMVAGDGRLCDPRCNHKKGSQPAHGLLPPCAPGSRRQLPALLASSGSISLPDFLHDRHYPDLESTHTQAARERRKAELRESGLQRGLWIALAFVCLLLVAVVALLPGDELGLGLGLTKSQSVQALATLSAPSFKDKDEEKVEFDEQGEPLTRVGAVLVSQHVLGYGSSGTVVFKGSLNGRAVAVKRLLTQFNWTAEREIALLIRSDGHPNVVRYYLSERCGDFVYLCLQLCAMSLKDFVTRLQHCRDQIRLDALSTVGSSPQPRGLLPPSLADEVIPGSPARRALQQVAEGLAHLHAQHIVHRDIKPHNILCAPPELHEASNSSSSSSANKDIAAGGGCGTVAVALQDHTHITNLNQIGDFVLKISDMGLSKQLTRDQESVSGMSFSAPIGEPSLSLSRRPAGAAEGPGQGEGSANSHRTHVAAQPVGTIGWQAPELIALRGQSLAQRSAMECMQQPALAVDEGDDPGLDRDQDTVSGGSVSTNHSHSQSGASHSQSQPNSDLAFTSAAAVVAPRARFRPQQVDVFSLGCVFYYVLSGGQHPYGQWYEREANIMLDRSDLSALLAWPDAMHLISSMLSRDPRARPSAKQVAAHPFFWPPARRLDFLSLLSDRLEQEAADSTAVLMLEGEGQAQLGRGWDRRLDPGLLEDMGRYRKYDPCSLRDLLRVVRNKRSHYAELSPAVKAAVGELPGPFLLYFESRFPRLLMHSLTVACMHMHLAAESDLTAFCAPIATMFISAHTSAPIPIQASAISVVTSTATSSSTHTRSSLSPLTRPSTALNGTDLTPSSPLSQSQHNPDARSAESTSNSMVVDIGEVVVWHGTALTSSCRVRGWWRDDTHWINHQQNLSGAGRHGKGRPAHLTRSAADPKYRSRLCTHWELTQECVFKKKGKCDFAHGPLELRVKDTRRDRWVSNARQQSAGIHIADPNGDWLRASAGEDVLGAARSIEKIRAAEGPIASDDPRRQPILQLQGGVTANRGHHHSQHPPQPYLSHPSSGRQQQQQQYQGLMQGLAVAPQPSPIPAMSQTLSATAPVYRMASPVRPAGNNCSAST